MKKGFKGLFRVNVSCIGHFKKDIEGQLPYITILVNFCIISIETYYVLVWMLFMFGYNCPTSYATNCDNDLIYICSH